MNTTTDEIKTCRGCRTTFQARIDDDDVLFVLTNLCDSCLSDNEAFEAELQAGRAKQQEKRISENKIEVAAGVNEDTPDLFKRTDINHPEFNKTAWAKIQIHELSNDLPWIGFVGMTGRCKSRMAYLKAAELIVSMTSARKATFAFVASYEITDAVTRMHCDFEAKREARSFLDQLRKVDVLLIDDLGKGRLTPAVASELFALIDQRHLHEAITIWTSNSTPEVIAAGLPEDMSGPFVGRINESSKIFTFK